ncbi:hypothetical protein BGX38DRAFT_1182104 [Terfezia claveryi]|nr:hypothetical protein BGX38DRAFT_1182104 [Terfezia claveryi]
MGQIQSSPPKTNSRSQSTPVSRSGVLLHPRDDTENWVILEKCPCGETRCVTSDTTPPRRESKDVDVTPTTEQQNYFLPTEVPQSLVPVGYNLTAEDPVCPGDENPAQPRNEENDGITMDGRVIGNWLFQGATWSYLGVRWIIPPVPGVVEDMIATLQSGMGM